VNVRLSPTVAAAMRVMRGDTSAPMVSDAVGYFRSVLNGVERAAEHVLAAASIAGTPIPKEPS
jgi:hypothetical protein